MSSEPSHIEYIVLVVGVFALGIVWGKWLL
jgi:hypothetical protein